MVMIRCNLKSLMSARFPELSFLCMHSLEHRCIQKSTGFRIKSSGVGSWVLSPTNVTLKTVVVSEPKPCK